VRASHRDARASRYECRGPGARPGVSLEKDRWVAARATPWSASVRMNGETLRRVRATLFVASQGLGRTMNEDVRFLLRCVGCLPTTLGAIAIALASFYFLSDLRFGGAFLSWALMWGLMLAGIGLGLMSTGRRWMAAVGSVASGFSAFLVYDWERTVGSLENWRHWIYGGDALGLAAVGYFSWRPPARRGATPKAGTG
jgi:hypothetical protein